MAYRRDRRSPELARLFLAQPKSEMPQSSSRGSREEAGPGRKGREEEASEPGREGGENTPGAGQGRSPLARSARLSAAAAVSLSLSRLPPPTNRPQASQADGRASCELPFGRWAPQKPAAAAGRRAPRLQACALSNPTWSQAPPGRRARAPELGCLGAGLPCIWDRRLTSTRMQADLGTRVRGLPLHGTLPEPGCGDPNTLGTSVREHAPAHRDRAPRRKHVHANTYTACAAGPVCAHPGRRLGFCEWHSAAPLDSAFGLDSGPSCSTGTRV